VKNKVTRLSQVLSGKIVSLVTISELLPVQILSMFYEQLLRKQISEAQKYNQAVSLFALLGSLGVKASCKVLMKLTTDCVNLSIFYDSLFCLKLFYATFLELKFGFVVFGTRISVQMLLVKYR